MSIELIPNGWCPAYSVAPCLTPEECAWVIEQAEATGFSKLLSVDANQGLIEYQPKKTVSLRLTEGEIFDLVSRKVSEAASVLNENYGFDLFEAEARVPVVYVLKYLPEAQLNLHTDMGGYEGMDTRKLNATIKLNAEYEGGELYLIEDDTPRPLQGRAVGTVAAYPAWQLHGVERVFSGVRYSMAAWINGPRFR